MMQIRNFIQKILDLDFSVASSPIRSLQKSSSGAQVLQTHEGLINLPIGDAYEIFGVAQCDNNATITFEWGFGHDTSTKANDSGVMVKGGGKTAPVFVAKETISVTGAAINTSGGVKIGPVLVAGEVLRVSVLNGVDTATGNFRIYLAKRT